MLKGEHLFSGFFYAICNVTKWNGEFIESSPFWKDYTFDQEDNRCMLHKDCVCFCFFLSMEMSFSENKCSHGCINTSAREKWASTQSACTALGTEQHSDFLKEAPCATTT